MSDRHALYRAEQVRELDRRAIQEHGIPGYTLMQRAAAAAYAHLGLRWPDRRALSVFCGPGNNAGDGYVLARLALEDGRRARLVTLADPARLKGDARQAWLDAQAAGVAMITLAEFSPGADEVLVDALLGTGLQRPLEGDYRAAVEAINAAGAPVLALDIPSGLHADSGAELGMAVRAQMTVSFIGLKAGLYTGRGPACCGRIQFADLAVPEAVYRDLPPAAYKLDGARLYRHLPRRARDAHKGDSGHLLVVGGDTGFGGAALMAALAALRSGAGLVTVAMRPEYCAAMSAAHPEIMFAPVAGPADLAPLLRRADVVAVGPGLGRSDWGQALLDGVLESGRALVLDADALNLLAGQPEQRRDWILTPHPGEAARLLGLTSGEVQRDRYAALAALAERYGGTVVLKGAGSLVRGADGIPRVCAQGNPGMAVAGMGDLLTGIIGALRAQGLAPEAAAQLGVCMHAGAGDLAAFEGQRGLMATDLLPHIHHLANRVVRGPVRIAP